MNVVYPVRCPRCRARLTSKPFLQWKWTRWCKRCRCTVSYIEEADNWYLLGALVDD